MDPGWIGGIVGGAIGLMGGALGTYASIRNTRTPRERAFVVRAAMVCWVAVTALIAALVLLPGAKVWLWLAYGLALPLAVRYWNRRQAQISREESNHGA